MGLRIPEGQAVQIICATSQSQSKRLDMRERHFDCKRKRWSDFGCSTSKWYILKKWVSQTKPDEHYPYKHLYRRTHFSNLLKLRDILGVSKNLQWKKKVKKGETTFVLGSGNTGIKRELPKSQAELDLGKEIKTNSKRCFSHRSKNGFKKAWLYTWIDIKTNLCLTLKWIKSFDSVNCFWWRRRG